MRSDCDRLLPRRRASVSLLSGLVLKKSIGWDYIQYDTVLGAAGDWLGEGAGRGAGVAFGFVDWFVQVSMASSCLAVKLFSSPLFVLLIFFVLVVKYTVFTHYLCRICCSNIRLPKKRHKCTWNRCHGGPFVCLLMPQYCAYTKYLESYAYVALERRSSCFCFLEYRNARLGGKHDCTWHYAQQRDCSS